MLRNKFPIPGIFASLPAVSSQTCGVVCVACHHVALFAYLVDERSAVIQPVTIVGVYGQHWGAVFLAPLPGQVR